MKDIKNTVSHDEHGPDIPEKGVSRVSSQDIGIDRPRDAADVLAAYSSADMRKLLRKVTLLRRVLEGDDTSTCTPVY